ncbi:MAG: 23S rRNA (guanosine(2251)-2'-O)-methyltransferase RlmB [Nitrospinota bacterium]|nr:23S rRNA (guanosine(2251)-2'-O)-methyltransferase RlmB [Nitrospinota bacterium]MDP6617996.1 23S rRNA (guanosine(2251)-2'-O)-methyltransferase RlmB [Nitrospinota bacterium]HJM43317.1 23S rRNA (guanosine(2251)-2'-O)-methyltransferase RlmB [Nitrospinota bacterium]
MSAKRVRTAARGRASEEPRTLYGLRPVRDALRAGRRTIEGVWVLSGREDSSLAEVVEAAERAGAPLSRADRGRLTELAGSPDHQGAVARAGPLPLLPLEAVAGESPADDAGGGGGGGRTAVSTQTLLVLDSVVDPRNFGALCRSALALGCRGVVFPKDRSAGPTPAAAKAAAGALEYLPLARVTNLARALESLKEWGWWIIGLAEEGERSPGEIRFDGPAALVVGGEGSGLRRLVRERCDHLMRIETNPDFPTLNASVAVAVALYEIQKRRGTGGEPSR